MKTQISNPVAVAAGATVTWLGTFKCCALPAALSLLGLTGTAAALLAQWLAPALAVISAAMLARSFYTLYGLRRGSVFSRVTTWVSAGLVILLWGLRLAAAWAG